MLYDLEFCISDGTYRVFQNAWKGIGMFSRVSERSLKVISYEQVTIKQEFY